MKVNKPGALDFADYIKKLPPQWVIEHFLEDFDDSRKILSSSMIDDAVNSFSSAEVLKDRFLHLPSDIQLRCALAYLSGNKGISLEESNPFEDSLVLSFLTYAAIDNDRNIRIFGFDQFEKYLRPQIVKVLLNAAKVENITPPAEVFAFKVINDMTTIAGLCLQGAIVKKKRGGIAKSTSDLLKKLINIGSASKSDDNDFVYSVAIGYLSYKKMIVETETHYRLVLPAFLSWLSESKSSRLHEIEMFCFNYSGGWRRELFLSLINEDIDNWISSRMFIGNDLKDAINTLYSLRFCGLIDLKHKDGEIVFCKSRTVEKLSIDQRKGIVVLPDFSAIIPQEIESAELFNFSQLGTLQSLDRVYWGKVDKTVILDSCSRGTDAIQIMQLLSGWQAPVNVLETVREWLREFLRLYITDQNILISNDEKVTMQLNSYDPVRSYLEPVAAHAVFRIKKGSEDKVKEVLRNLGFDYRMPGHEVGEETDQNYLEVNPVSAVDWVPVTEVQKLLTEPATSMRGTKYGSELKILDTSEIVHVIDYAMLTGGSVCFDYEGSPYIKQGFYTVKPLSFQKGIEPAFEGEITRTKSKKMFYLKKILKIGVVQR